MTQRTSSLKRNDFHNDSISSIWVGLNELCLSGRFSVTVAMPSCSS